MINILSLFDGMSCGQIALQKLGVTDYTYYASEIDKYAIAVTQRNFPGTIQLGDITKIKGSDLPPIDAIWGGSPCQGFSFAGKQLNFNDPRSSLFFEFVRLLKECKPKFFLLENVKMKKEYQDVISGFLGVEPVELNSSLVSAQMRKRLYWANFAISAPEDRGLRLQDVLEEAITEKEKSYCIDASYARAGAGSSNEEAYLENNRRQLVYQQSRAYDPLGKPPALCAAGERGGVLLQIGRITGRRLNERGVREDSNPSLALSQVLEVSQADKSNCLSTVEKDNVLTPLLPGRYLDAYGRKLPFRKLTVRECERLQTVPDDYTAGVSNSQRYKMLGNGWTVDMVEHILRGIPFDALDLF